MKECGGTGPLRVRAESALIGPADVHLRLLWASLLTCTDSFVSVLFPKAVFGTSERLLTWKGLQELTRAKNQSRSFELNQSRKRHKEVDMRHNTSGEKAWMRLCRFKKRINKFTQLCSEFWTEMFLCYQITCFCITADTTLKSRHLVCFSALQTFKHDG